jgi:hypothetical protein
MGQLHGIVAQHRQGAAETGKNSVIFTLIAHKFNPRGDSG